MEVSFSGALGERGDRNLCWNVETDILHVAVTVAICPNFSGRSPLTIVSCVCGETCIKIESLICHMAMQPPLSFSFWAHFYTHKVRGWVWNPSVSSVHSVEPTSESTFPLWLSLLLLPSALICPPFQGPPRPRLFSCLSQEAACSVGLGKQHLQDKAHLPC